MQGKKVRDTWLMSKKMIEIIFYDVVRDVF